MFQTIIGAVSSFMYSKLLVIMLIGAGLYFTIRTRFPQARLFKRACESVMEKPDDKEAGLNKKPATQKQLIPGQ